MIHATRSCDGGSEEEARRFRKRGTRILGFEALSPDGIQQLLRLVRRRGVEPRREHGDALQHVFCELLSKLVFDNNSKLSDKLLHVYAAPFLVAP